MKEEVFNTIKRIHKKELVHSGVLKTYKEDDTSLFLLLVFSNNNNNNNNKNNNNNDNDNNMIMITITLDASL